MPVPDHYYYQTRIYYADSATHSDKYLLVGKNIVDSTGNSYKILGYREDGVDLTQGDLMNDPSENGSFINHSDGMLTYLLDAYPDWVSPVEDTDYNSQLVISPVILYSETLSFSVVQQITRAEVTP